MYARIYKYSHILIQTYARINAFSNPYRRIHTFILTHNTYKCTYTCIHSQSHIDLQRYTYKHTLVHVYKYLKKHVYIYMHTYKYANSFLHALRAIHIYMHSHALLHAHIHACVCTYRHIQAQNAYKQACTYAHTLIYACIHTQVYANSGDTDTYVHTNLCK